MPVQQEPALEILGDTYGNHGGTPFDDRAQAESGPISQVTLHAGAFVDAISITYGNLITWHGGPGGDPHNLTLQPGEYITHVEGRVGTWLDYLKLTTNLGQTVAAGGHGGHPFTVPNPNGLALHAILGREGSFIDQIQFVFGPPPSPAKPKAAAKKAVAKKATAKNVAAPKAETPVKSAASKKSPATSKTTTRIKAKPETK
jgi:hypothetical protein